MSQTAMKKLFALVLPALLLSALFCCGTAIADGEITTWSGLQTALNAGGTVILTQDLEAGPNDTMLQVSGTVTLDLNGHTLDRHRTTAHADGHVIIVNAGGYLTLTDSSPDHTGAITGGYANNGGGINNKGTLRAENVTITGNHVSGSNNSGRGAGIYNNDTLILIGCTISGNSGDDAGGIFNDVGGTVNLYDMTITGNTSTHHGGGGIVNYGMLTLSNCTVSSNTAYSNGGGIWTEGTLVSLNSCTLSGNTSGDKGGALYVSSGTVSTNGCTFSGNTAHDGGAIFITANGIVVNNGDPSVAGSTSVTGNTATVNGGGGITNYGKLATDDSLTVTGNTAAGNGGGIWLNGTFEAKGTVTVKSNKSGEADNDLYLKSGKVITLTGALDSASEIRISAENPLAQVTSGWSAKMGETAPSGCIAYDDGMSMAVPKNGEVSFRIGYVERSWNGSENAHIPENETPILYNGQAELTNAWVVVSRTQTLSGRLGINGTVHLILMDGWTA